MHETTGRLLVGCPELEATQPLAGPAVSDSRYPVAEQVAAHRHLVAPVMVTFAVVRLQGNEQQLAHAALRASER
ncbi:MAG: hypothetical protein AAF628_34060 [Planctomycetota bacterium]